MIADTLIAGGRIFRGLAGGFTDAVALKDGKVFALGDSALAAAGSQTRHIDLDGRVAIPAFNEAHMHLLPYGLGLTQVNLRAEEVRTLDEVLLRISTAAKSAPKGAWVIGRGYDHGELDVGRHPTAAELDAAAPENPVYIVRTCGHMGVANSTALKLAGVGHNTPDPEGGVIERKGGVLTGLFLERAQRLVKDAMPVPDQARMVDAIEAACSHLASLGFASATDMNVGMTAGMAEVTAYETAKATGRLPLRMWQVLAGNPEGIAQDAWAAGLRPMQGDDSLRWGAVKVFADGSAGGLTAAFFEPYLASRRGRDRRLHLPRRQDPRAAEAVSRAGLAARHPRHRRCGDRAGAARHGRRRQRRASLRRPAPPHRTLRLRHARPAPADEGARHPAGAAAGVHV